MTRGNSAASAGSFGTTGRHSTAESVSSTASRFRAAPWIFIVLLIVLAALGAANQNAFLRQDSLIDRKTALQSAIASLRLGAATVSGPIVIGNWARENGMIPAPQGTSIREVAPEPLPVRPPAVQTGMEVTTVWR